MPIELEMDGVKIKCDTAEEAAALMKRLARAPADPDSPADDLPLRFTTLLASQDRRRKNAGIRTYEMAASLGLRGGQALGPITRALTTRLEPHGLSLSDVAVREERPDGTYWVPRPRARQAASQLRAETDDKENGDCRFAQKGRSGLLLGPTKSS